MSGERNFRWARELMAGLAAAGVREAVVSPGSRSTPLTLAAAAEPGLHCRVIVDERSAAFFALGQARATCRPSVLVCTSGTAGANYFPAVIEAAEANTPLIAITADRPPELLVRGALQTVDQAQLFGRYPRAFIDLGPADDDERALAGVRAAGALAVARALDPRPGPVHVNAPFRAPLEPTAGLDRQARPAAPRPPRFIPARRAPAPDAVAALAKACRAARRGVLIAGPGPMGNAAMVPAAVAVARRLGFPLLAEATSQARFAGCGREVVGLFEMLVPAVAGDAFRPDLVLQLGPYPTSAAWGRWLESADRCERWVIAPHGWGDPANLAVGVVAADLDLALAALLAALGEGEPADPGWAALWRRAEDAVRDALAAAERAETSAGLLSESTALRAVVRALPEGSLLAVANSLAIRELDLACAPEDARVGVLSQRGASGIDGTVSAAAGAASVARSPVTAVLGDLALIHDVGGLAACRHAVQPLVLVVLDNGGGRIFDLLPVADGRLERRFVDELFVARQPVDLAAAAGAFGLPHRRAATAAELGDALAAAHAAGGCWLVEAAISGAGARERRLALRTAVQTRVRGLSA